MRRVALGLLAFSVLLSASAACFARGAGHGAGHGHGHGAGHGYSTKHHQS